MSSLSQKELQILTSLKKLSVYETALEMEISTSNVYSTLYYIRNKYERCRRTVNILDKMKGDNQRLARLLRRTESRLTKEDEQ